MNWNKLRLSGVANVDLPIFGADPSGPYILKGVEGLDPPPVDTSIMRVRGQRGVRQNRDPQYRQIVCLVGLQPDWDTGQTSAELRSELYGLLAPKFDLPARASIMLNNTVLAIAEGDVSNIDASIFSKDPEVQVTLDCDYGYLLAPAVQEQIPTRTVVATETVLDIENDGDAPAGFKIEFTLQQAVTDLTLRYDYSLGKVMTITGPHAAGDAFIIDTRPGSRKVNKILSGQSTQKSVLNNLTVDSSWLQLHKGDNKLILNATLFDWRTNAFVHTPAYQGV